VKTLKKKYTDKKLIIPTISLNDLSENYFIADFAERTIGRLKCDTRTVQEEMMKFLQDNLAVEELPYGYSSYRALLPYLLHPHSVSRISENQVCIFFKQAPYFRLLDISSKDSKLISGGNGIDYGKIISSTSKSDEKKNFYFSENSAVDRLAKYKGQLDTMDFSLYYFDTTGQKAEQVSGCGRQLIDNFHEVSCSENGFVVLLDMNLSVDDFDGKRVSQDEKIIYTEEFRKEYADKRFPTGKVFVYDPDRKEFIAIEPPLQTPAHVEFDPEDPAVFYISCHNISKIRSKVIIHGPAAIVKYRYADGKVEQLGQYMARDFLRITTHKLFTYRGRKLIGATVYPNALHLIDADTMELHSRIPLFETSDADFDLDGPHIHICSNDHCISLFFDIENESDYCFMGTSRYIYIIDLAGNSVVEKIQYTEENVSATSHITLV